MADSGYSWVVLVATFFLDMHHSAGFSTIGIFLLEFMDHFDVPKSAATPIAGLFLCIGFLFGFPVGWLCRSYGCPPVALAAGFLNSTSLILSSFASSVVMLYFTCGCLASFGISTFMITANIAIQQAFDKRRAFASGVSITGASVGVFVWPPLSRWLIDMYWWRGALFLLAGIHLHSLVFAMLLHPVPISTTVHNMKMQEIDLQLQLSKSEKGSRYRVHFKTKFKSLISPVREHPAFCAYLVGIVFMSAGHIIPYSLLPIRSKALNINQTLAATLVSAIGMCSGIARPVAGYVADCKCVSRLLFSGLSAALAGILTALSFILTSYEHIMIYSCLEGVVSGACIALAGATVVDLVGIDNAALGIGYLYTAIGAGYLLALTVSGKLLDEFSDPGYTFLVFGAIEAMGGTIMIVTMVIRKLQKRIPKNQNFATETSSKQG